MNSKTRSWFKKQLTLAIDTVIQPDAQQVDELAQFPIRSVETLKHRRLLGLLVPESYGGLGGTLADFTYAVEQLARACSSTAAVFFFHGQFVRRLADFGDPVQKSLYMPRLAYDYLGASSWSELKAGADKTNLSTTARIQGSSLLINGSKAFCTSAGEADIYSVLVKFEGQDGPQTSFVLIEKKDARISFGQSWNGMGLRGSSTHEIICDQIQIPSDRILGIIGEGHKIMEQNKKNAIHPGILGLGIARSALHAFLRDAENKSHLWGYQNTRMVLGDIAIAVESLEALTYKAARAADEESEHAAYYAMQAKVMAARVAVETTDKLLHLAGAGGYTKGHPLERLYRDAKAIGLMGPTSEIAKEFVANTLREAFYREHDLRPHFI